MRNFHLTPYLILLTALLSAAHSSPHPPGPSPDSDADCGCDHEIPSNSTTSAPLNITATPTPSSTVWITITDYTTIYPHLTPSVSKSPTKTIWLTLTDYTTIHPHLTAISFASTVHTTTPESTAQPFQHPIPATKSDVSVPTPGSAVYERESGLQNTNTDTRNASHTTVASDTPVASNRTRTIKWFTEFVWLSASISRVNSTAGITALSISSMDSTAETTASASMGVMELDNGVQVKKLEELERTDENDGMWSDEGRGMRVEEA